MVLSRHLVAMTASLAVFCSVAAADDNERGEKLFELCSTCHGVTGAGNADLEAPAIAGLSDWYVEAQLIKFRTGARGGDPDDAAGLRMRPMSRALRSDDDVRLVSAFVASLPPPRREPLLEGGDPARGEQLYRPCAACHGARGEGNPQLNAPSVGTTNDWYLLSQLEKFKSGDRGTDPKDTTGALMRPMAATLIDEQAMKDVIAYMMTFSP